MRLDSISEADAGPNDADVQIVAMMAKTKIAATSVNPNANAAVAVSHSCDCVSVNGNGSHLNNHNGTHNGNGNSNGNGNGTGINNNNNGEEVHLKGDYSAQEIQVHKSESEDLRAQETDSSLISDEHDHDRDRDGDEHEEEERESGKWRGCSNSNSCMIKADEDENENEESCDRNGFNKEAKPIPTPPVQIRTSQRPTAAVTTNGMTAEINTINEAHTRVPACSDMLTEVVNENEEQNDEEYYYYYEEEDAETETETETEETGTDSDSDATITNEMLLHEDNGAGQKQRLRQKQTEVKAEEDDEDEEVIAEEADENEFEWPFGNNNISPSNDYTNTKAKAESESKAKTSLACERESADVDVDPQGEQAKAEAQAEAEDEEYEDDEGIEEDELQPEHENTASWIDDNKPHTYTSTATAVRDDDDEAERESIRLSSNSGERAEANKTQNANSNGPPTQIYVKDAVVAAAACTSTACSGTGTFPPVNASEAGESSSCAGAGANTSTNAKPNVEHALWRLTGISTGSSHHPENDKQQKHRHRQPEPCSTSESGTNNKSTSTTSTCSPSPSCSPKCTRSNNGNGQCSLASVAERSSSSESSCTSRSETQSGSGNRSRRSRSQNPQTESLNFLDLELQLLQDQEKVETGQDNGQASASVDYSSLISANSPINSINVKYEEENDDEDDGKQLCSESERECDRVPVSGSEPEPVFLPKSTSHFELPLTIDTSTQCTPQQQHRKVPHDNNGGGSAPTPKNTGTIEPGAKLRLSRERDREPTSSSSLLKITKLLQFRDRRKVSCSSLGSCRGQPKSDLDKEKIGPIAIRDNSNDIKPVTVTVGVPEATMHQRVGMANSSSTSSSTTSSSSTLRSVLRRPGLGKQRPRGRCVTFNESLNLFYDAECSCWVHEDEYSRMRQEEIERRERESEMYQQQYEMQMAAHQHQYLQPYEFDDPPTLSPPEGYKDRFFPQEFFTIEPDVTRVSPPSPPTARRKIFLKGDPMPPPPPGVSVSMGPPHTTNGVLSSLDEDEPPAEYETTKKKGSRYILGGILKGGRLWRSNSNDGKKAASTPPDEPDIVKCSEASPTQYSQTEPLQQHALQTHYYETNSLVQMPMPMAPQMAPTKVDIGTAPLRTSEQIRLAVDSTLRMRSSNKKKPECSSLVEKLRWLTSLDDEDSSDGQSGFATWPARDKNGVSVNNGNGSGSGSSPVKLSSDAGTSTNEELFVQSSSSMRQQQPVQEARIKQISYTLEDIEEGLIKGTESELETFITKDGGRIERLRKRYGDDGAGGNADDYGFSRRPSVKGIKPKFSTSNQIFAQFTTNNTPGMTATLPNPNRKSTSTPIPVLIGQVDNNNSSSGILMGSAQAQLMNPEFQQQQQRLMGEGQYENARLPESNLIVVNSSASAGGSGSVGVRNHAHVSLSPAMMLPNSSSSTSTNSSSNGGGSITSSDTSTSSSTAAGATAVGGSAGGMNAPNNNNNEPAPTTSVRQAALNYEFQNTPGRQTEESRAHFEMIRQSFENASGNNAAAGGGGGGPPGANFVNFSRPHSWSVGGGAAAPGGGGGTTNLGHTQSFNTHNQQPHHIYQQVQPAQHQHQHAHSNSISGPMTGISQQQQPNHVINNQNNMYGTLTNSHQHPMSMAGQQQQQQQGLQGSSQQQVYGTVRRVPNVIGRPLFLHYNGALSVEAHPNKIVYPKTKVPETPSPTQPPSIRYYGPPIRYYNPPPPVPPRTVTAQSSGGGGQAGSSGGNTVIITAQSGINNLNHPHGAGGGGNHPHVNVLLTMNDVERGAPEGATDEEPSVKEPSYLMNV